MSARRASYEGQRSEIRDQRGGGYRVARVEAASVLFTRSSSSHPLLLSTPPQPPFTPHHLYVFTYTRSSLHFPLPHSPPPHSYSLVIHRWLILLHHPLATFPLWLLLVPRTPLALAGLAA